MGATVGLEERGIIIQENDPVRRTLFPDPPIRTPVRRRNPFIDDSAVESDGDGGDISSTASTPLAPSPIRAPPVLALRSKPLKSIKKTTVKVKVINLISPAVTLGPSFEIKPSHSVNRSGLTIINGPSFVINPKSKAIVSVETCDKCGTKVNGPKQLQIHRDSKICKKRAKTFKK